MTLSEILKVKDVFKIMYIIIEIIYTILICLEAYYKQVKIA